MKKEIKKLSSMNHYVSNGVIDKDGVKKGLGKNYSSLKKKLTEADNKTTADNFLHSYCAAYSALQEADRAMCIHKDCGLPEQNIKNVLSNDYIKDVVLNEQLITDLYNGYDALVKTVTDETNRFNLNEILGFSSIAKHVKGLFKVLGPVATAIGLVSLGKYLNGLKSYKVEEDPIKKLDILYSMINGIAGVLAATDKGLATLVTKTLPAGQKKLKETKKYPETGHGEAKSFETFRQELTERLDN